MSPASKPSVRFLQDMDYRHVHADDNRSSSESESKEDPDSELPLLEEELTRRRHQRGSWLGRLLERLKGVRMPPKMLMLNLVLGQALMASLYYIWCEKTEMNGRLKAVSIHSPFLNRIEVPLVPRMSFAQYGMGGQEIWRSEPSEEVDRAWEGLIAEYIIPVKHSDIVAMDKDPSEVVPMPAEYKIDGEQTYMAKSAAFHNIHCLDWIRKSVYKDHYYPNGTHDVPFYDYHTAHCIMVVLEHLTCFGDPGVYLYRWMDQFARPIADTNIWRKCWDFEAVLQRHNAMAVHDMMETDVKKPMGIKGVEAPWQIIKIIEDFKKGHPDSTWDPRG